MIVSPATRRAPDATIRPLVAADLAPVHRITRLAFGRLHHTADPESFMQGIDLVGPRWHADPGCAFVAEIDGRVVGSIVTTRWGSVGFPGPMSVHPDRWDCGIGKRLLAHALDCYARWHTPHVVFFTYPGSTRHVAWYQTLGFWPRHPIVVMARPVERAEPTPGPTLAPGRRPTRAQAAALCRYSAIAECDRPAVLDACRELTGTLCDGLDVTHEIRAVAAQRLGDTLLLWDGDRLDGFAVCQWGAGTEAGADACYIKCAAVRTGASAAAHFEELLARCETLAAIEGASRLVAGANTARRHACERLAARGFRMDMLGVSMQTDGHDLYNRRDIYALDDWR